MSDEDAVAAVDEEPPLTADEATWAEILGYRRVLTYVLNVSTEPGFVIEESVLRSMHFMLLEHDLSTSPGRYRTTEVFVRDALLGLRVTRPSYVKLAGLDERTATRDLVHAAQLGLLEARGERRGRHYVAGKPLQEIRQHLRAERRPLADPYPALLSQIRRSLT